MARQALGPATLRVTQAIAAIVEGNPAPMLVACSGGPDSLALAAGTVPVARRLGLAASAVVVDHGLQSDSATVAAKVVDQLAQLGLAAEVVAVQVQPDGTGPEAAARTARYAALQAAAERQDALVLLGHTLDDQAETVLLGLARGSGTRSLAGMAPARGPFRRPLLGLTRADTELVCRELGLHPWADPHNQDPAFTRSRIRHRVMPVLEAELGPGVAPALARTAALAAADADLLDRQAAQALQAALRGGDGPECDALAGLPEALRTRAVRQWLIDAGCVEPSFAHVAAVDQLITRWHGQRWVAVPGLRVARRDGRLQAMAG